MRDLLLYPGYHFILVGTADALATVVGAHAQVRSVFGIAEPLAPLTPEEVQELLDRRYKYLRLNLRRPFIAPVQRDAVAEVYALFRGDLRGTLRALEQAADRLAGYGDPAIAPLSATDISHVLQPVYLSELSHTVSQSTARLLLTLGEFADRPFVQKDLVRRRRAPQSTVSTALQEWLRFGYVEISGKEGRTIIYRLTGAARLMLATTTAK